MKFYVLTGLINAFTCVSLGTFVYLKNRKSFTNKIFALFTFAVALWGLGVFFYLTAANSQTAFAWIDVALAGAILIPVGFFHFVVSLLDLRKSKRKLIILGYILTFLFFIANFTPLFNESIYPYYPYRTIPGKAYPFFLVMFFGYVIYSWYLIVKNLKKVSGIKREQLRYVLIGTFIGFCGGSVNFLFDFGITPVELTWFNLSGGICVAILAYAIARYRLMDIRVVVGKGVVYFFSIVAAISVSFLFAFISYRAFNYPFYLMSIFTAVLGIIFFQYFFQFCEQIAQRYFYYTFYSYKTILANLGKKLIHILDLQELTSLIVGTLVQTIKIDKISFTFKQAATEFYQFQKTIGFDEKEVTFIIRDTALCAYLEKTGKPLLTEEILAEARKTEDELEKENLRAINQKLETNQVSIVLPLFEKKRIVGILFLGEKVSGNPYSAEDIEILETLSYQISIALQNSLLYDELKKDKDMLERFYKLTIGRELKMAELKQKIKELEEKLAD